VLISLSLSMQDVIGGNSKTLMFANINPLSISETVSTLNFASRVRLVRNNAQRTLRRVASSSSGAAAASS
jgi:hypothetical protein